jgi:beta-galactosidase
MERKLKYLSWEITDGDNSVVVEAEHTFTSPSGAPLHGMIPCQIKLRFNCDDTLTVESRIYSPASLPPLPRAGLSLALSSSFSRVEWLGLGPHEAYDDRKACVHLGVFSADVATLHTPYVVPQENARRASPR